MTTLVVATAPALTAAQDIDLFLVGGGEGDPPNVLLIIDNSANWGSNIDGTTQEMLTRQALNAVFVESAELVERVRVGFMPFSHRNNPRGSKVISHVQMLDEAYQGVLGKLIDKDDDHEGRSLVGTNNSPYAMAMHEAYLYFRGEAPFSGEFLHQGAPDPTEVDPAAFREDGRYHSPAKGNCGKNYVIVVGNGAPDQGENNIAESKLDGLGGVLSSDPIALDPNNFAANWADEFSRFMANNDVVPDCIRQGDQHVTTFVIDVFNPGQTQNRPFMAARAWMRSIARWGDGRYFPAHSAEDIQFALNRIMDELLAINSVFASATLPVSVNVRGINLNQVYMGQFRPDAQNRPRWLGNLKLYQLARDAGTNTLFLADSVGASAESGTTGFIQHDAISFWTTQSNFWEYEPRGTPPSGSDRPDGDVVEKGGAAQRLREAHDTEAKIAGRNVYTCIDACLGGGRLADSRFDTANTGITAARLGVASDAERTALIEWLRGRNNVTDVNDDDSRTDAIVRPSIHGDVLHSRPAVINYGDHEDDDADVVVFYGANDGALHALRGGKRSDSGHEMWSFVPEEFFGDLNAIRDNTEVGKRYFIDGSIGALHQRAGFHGADQDRVWLYVTMRRGGRFIYALDVTEPEDPRLLWRRTHEDPGFEELGQTWSLPVTTRISNEDGAVVPVVIFGAGYDDTIEDLGVSELPRTMGRGIFMLDAETGELIWQAGPAPDSALTNKVVPEMQHSFAADLAVLDRNRNGLADRIYAADTGGNIWRVDIHDPDHANWQVHHVAELGNDQKFLFRPDVVLADEKRSFDSILIGSGNREDPFDRVEVNHFYMLKDEPGPIGAGDTRFTRLDLFDATDNLIQDGDADEQSQAVLDLDAAAGWFVRLEGSGEKTVSSATTLNSSTFFNTNEPPLPPEERDETLCVNNLGIARTYVVDFADARAMRGSDDPTKEDRAAVVTGGGFPPSPVPVVVDIDGSPFELILIGPHAITETGSPLNRRQRIFWAKELDR